MLVYIKQRENKKEVLKILKSTQIYFRIAKIVEIIFADNSRFFKRGFIVNNDTMFAMHEVHSVSGQESDYYYLEVPSAIIGTFAVDANSDTIYFVDSKNNTLDKLDIISQQISTLTPILTGKGEKGIHI